MKRTIYLYGELAEKYGKSHTLFVHSVAEAVRALKANFPGFYDTIRNGRFHILRGKDLVQCRDVSEKELTILFPAEDFHFLPIVEGGKSEFWTIVAGIALIAISYYIPPAWAIGGASLAGVTAGAGIALVIGGVAQLLTPAPKVSSYADREHPDQRASLIFNGPVNRIEQGGPVPLVYGEMLTGSVVMAGAVDVEQM